MFKAVAFDLDGTLLDTIPDIAASLNHALSECGWPTHPVEKCKTFVGGGIIAAIRKALPPEADEDAVWAVHTVYQRVYPENCTVRTLPYPSIHEMLTTLHERGVPLAILSNKTDATTKRITAHYFPDIPFKGTFGRVPERPLKPDAGAAAPVLEVLNLRPEEIIYVGDSGTDMTFAKAAGMLPVAVPWGYRSREELVECGAEYVTNDVETLAELLGRITE